MNKQFFYLHFNEDDNGSVAVSCDIERNNKRKVPFILTMGVLQDYQANDLGEPLMSLALCETLKLGRAYPGLSWEESSVLSNDQVKVYYVPRFHDQPDILDTNASKIINGPIGDVVIKPVLASRKVAEYDFFSVPGSGVRLVISEALRDQIILKQLSGVDFSGVPVA